MKLKGSHLQFASLKQNKLFISHNKIFKTVIHFTYFFKYTKKVP